MSNFNLVDELKADAERYSSEGLTSAAIAERVIQRHIARAEVARHRIPLLKVLERHVAHCRPDVW